MDARTTIAEVPFAAIPNQSKLFLSYLEFAPATLTFYQRPPTIEALRELAHGGLMRDRFPRTEIVQILRRQNERFGGDLRCEQHITDLERPDCFAVVTGQQVGLFGGPLYTIYKAVTAIRIASELRAKDIQAVPVFWLDTDDHDLAEVTRCTVIEKDYSARVVDYRQMLFENGSESARPVGSIELPHTILQTIEDYLSHLPDGHWKEPLRSRLKSSYSPGASFAGAFGRFMAGLFAGHGLVLFDPRDEDAKRLAAPVFQRTLREARGLYEILTARTRALEAAGFHSQVSIPENSTLLFMHDQGERKAVLREGSDFALKGTDLRFNPDRLVQAAADSPEHFSPNVLLRPVVQDLLLPTLCYVGGPGEIAYFAQAEALYHEFMRPMPAIWPRLSLTMVDEETGSLMALHQITLEDCFQGKKHVLETMLRTSGNSGASGILATVQEGLTSRFEELRPFMAKAEASLEPAMETAKRKILHHLEGLRAKLVQSEAGQSGELLKKAELLMSTCFPNRNLQERELGICHFLSSSGPTVLDGLYSIMKLDSFAHRVLALHR